MDTAPGANDTAAGADDMATASKDNAPGANDTAVGPKDTSGAGKAESCHPEVGVSTNFEYVGSILKDRYYISKELGRGNIGVVFLAHDRQLHSKPVVIKVLLDACSENQWFRKKFSQEIEALSRVDHPGVVNVTDSGVTPDGKSFLVMQLIKGENLRAMIRHNGMDFELVAAIVRQAGQALTAAHEQGIIHCDLKPENIMLQDLGEGQYQVKIVDFGVAKVKNSQVVDAPLGTSVAGSAFYMAPEQYEGRPCPASDVFALGVIAYEMLTGRRPFNPPSQYQIIETIRSGVRISPQDLRPAIPDQAQELILKALSFGPACRPQRAREFGEMLAQALTAEEDQGTSPQSRAEPGVEIAHVLCIQLIGFSGLPTERQSSILKRVRQVINATDSFKKARSANQLISRSTGDGMALVFFGVPKAPAECALEIAREVKQDPEIALRMGLNSGPVYRVNDLNQAGDATGAGITVAQQVMNCGDAGHILVSQSTADVLAELSEWRDRLHDLGAHNIKEGTEAHLFNLYTGELGNSQVPRKLQKNRAYAMLLAAAAVLAVAVVIAVKLIFFNGPGPARPGPGPVPSPSAIAGYERALSYSLTVQKYQGNRKDGSPFTLADANRIFESKYHVKLNVITPQPGFFYVLNEGPPDGTGAPRYTMLYPASADKGSYALTRITAPEPADQWFEFDNRRGTEKLWLVWSDNPVAELEAVKGLANQQEGQIRDPALSNSIHGLLAKYGAAKLDKVTDEDAKQTTIRGSGGVLVYPLNLEHQ
jgi:serine/threonine protein kinase